MEHTAIRSRNILNLDVFFVQQAIIVQAHQLLFQLYAKPALTQMLIQLHANCVQLIIIAIKRQQHKLKCKIIKSKMDFIIVDQQV